MKTLRNLLVICAVVMMATAALAQGGQGRGGMRMMGGNNTMFLLQRKDVQTDLALTDDQKSKLDAMRSGMQDEMREIMQNAGGDREAMTAAFTKYMEKKQKEVDAVLTKEQVARLKQINIQIAGNRAVLQPEVQKELGLTDDQKSKLKDLQAKQQEAQQALFQKVRDQEITREEMQASMTNNQKAMDTEIAKILTDANKAKLKEMGGKEFKADKEGNGGN